MPTPHALTQEKLHIKKPTGPQTSGHAVDFGTFTHENNDYTAWITKLNKHPGVKGQEASMLEVAFSEIALLFIKPGLTPPTRIVIENQTIVGVASENFNVQIKKQMDKETDKKYYSFNPAQWDYKPITPTITENMFAQEKQKIQADLSESKRLAPEETLSDEALKTKMHLDETKNAVNFLDKMPKDFFVRLMKQHSDGQVIVDMESLASILTASYVLEEDDLHKGNIGFYVTEVKDDSGVMKKMFTFFKIDHDLMLVHKIISQKDARIANILYDKNSFKISVRDLNDFPDLKDSGNHYWPTQDRFLAVNKKAYSNKAERQAFADLKKDADFNRAKWHYFLKSAVIPIPLVDQSLNKHLDKNNEIDKINMVKNSIYSRQGQLKRKLLQSPAFRNYMKETGDESFRKIKQEIQDYIENSKIAKPEQTILMAELDDNFKTLNDICKNMDTSSPLRRSILLGCYNFSSKINPKEKDIDLAVKQFEHGASKIDVKNFTAACVTLDLIKKSKYAEKYANNVTQLIKAKKGYIDPQTIKSFKQFEEAADKIRMSNLPLKQQKKEILAILKKAQLPLDELRAIKNDLQKKEPNSPSLKFINQLRSHLWLVKKLLGTYGKTSTSLMMINEIDAQIKKHSVSTTQAFKDKMSLKKNEKPLAINNESSNQLSNKKLIS